MGVSAGAKRVGVVREKVFGDVEFGFTKVMCVAAASEVVVSLGEELVLSTGSLELEIERRRLWRGSSISAWFAAAIVATVCAAMRAL
jgi:hypothetical protein